MMLSTVPTVERKKSWEAVIMDKFFAKTSIAKHEVICDKMYHLLIGLVAAQLWDENFEGFQFLRGQAHI